MDLISNFNVSNATYFTIQLVFALVAFGFFVFSLLVSRQIQLMNRVLTTKLAPMFQFIGLMFVLASLTVFVLTILALFQ
jgi:Family of unknown function (DUF5657)